MLLRVEPLHHGGPAAVGDEERTVSLGGAGSGQGSGDEDALLYIYISIYIYTHKYLNLGPPRGVYFVIAP